MLLRNTVANSDGIENTPPPVYLNDYTDELDEAIDDDGTVPVPDGPGLGVEYDWGYIADNTTGSVHVYE